MTMSGWDRDTLGHPEELGWGTWAVTNRRDSKAAAEEITLNSHSDTGTAITPSQTPQQTFGFLHVLRMLLPHMDPELTPH